MAAHHDGMNLWGPGLQGTNVEPDPREVSLFLRSSTHWEPVGSSVFYADFKNGTSKYA
jgi:hypothetical protein